VYIPITIPFELALLLLPRAKYVTSHVPALGIVKDKISVGALVEGTVIALPAKYVEPVVGGVFGAGPVGPVPPKKPSLPVGP
jgi:hypothetical protein